MAEKTTGFTLTRIVDRWGEEYRLDRKVRYGPCWPFFAYGTQIVGWFRTRDEAINRMMTDAEPRRHTEWFRPDGSPDLDF